MRKMLNTLYVMTPEAYLHKDGLNVVMKVGEEERARIPIGNIEGIVCFTRAGISPGVMQLCVENGVTMSFLSPNGKFIGRIEGGVKGNVLLRTQQYRMADDKEKSLHVARLIVAGKIMNSCSVLRRYIRDYGKNERVEEAIGSLQYRKKDALSAESIDELRGHEGDAAVSYFGVFDELILQQKEYFRFDGRNRRPPRDAVNAMLSFTYTLLEHEVYSGLETVGLDPCVGFMHTLRPGRHSLALDMMEELRAYLCDRFVLSLINRRQVSESDFQEQGEASIVMTEECRIRLIKAWQARKKETVEHPFLGEKIPIGLIPYSQALLMARYVRGDLDDYPVFLMR